MLLPITARGLPRAIETPRFARLLRMRLSVMNMIPVIPFETSS